MALKIKSIFFLLFLFIFQRCSFFHEKEDITKHILIYAPNLNDKYKHEKSFSFLKIQDTSYSAIQTYRGGLIFGKTLNSKYKTYINTDVFSNFQSVLYDNELYIVLEDGNIWSPKSILLKISEDKHDVVVVMSNDYTRTFVFTPSKYKLRTSINQFHVGDTIIGEIELSYADSLYGYECDGFFMSIINQGTTEWKKKKIQLPSGENLFID